MHCGDKCDGHDAAGINPGAHRDTWEVSGFGHIEEAKGVCVCHLVAGLDRASVVVCVEGGDADGMMQHCARRVCGAACWRDSDAVLPTIVQWGGGICG